MPISTTITFGALLKQLRKQAGMTQRDLAAALDYSDALISNLEKNQRQPNLALVIERLIPALGLQEDPKTAAWLIERAAAARGEQPPASFTLQRTTHLVVQQDRVASLSALPALPIQLIGRAEEVTQLCHRLLGHHGRLLTLVGPPGIGKTTLALAVADHLQPHYRDGVVLVPLAAVNDAETMAFATLVTLGSRETSAKPPRVQLIEFLRRKVMLLVLDNLEQISDAAPFIADLLAECPRLVVLATSRERLHLRAEQRYKVPSLGLAFAVELFVQRAQAVDSDFCLTAHNRPLLETICERLDRLPLAIELCAAQIELFSPAQLLAELQARPLDLLVDGAHDLPPQHRTLRRAIQRSYRLLSEAERTLLRSLGIFVGGFALPEVEAVMTGRLETREWRLNDEAIPQSLLSSLRSLISKSLVRAETSLASEQRSRLLETLREFALEQARAHNEEARLRQHHYAAYLHLFRTGSSYLFRAEAGTWIARLEPEQDNLRVALQWALDRARYADMAWLLLAANVFWLLNGQRYETGRWIARLLPHRQTLAADLRLAILILFIASARDSGEFPAFDQYRVEIIHLMEVCPGKQLQSVGWHFLAQSVAERTQAYELARAASEAPTLGPEFGEFADYDFVLAANQLGYAGILYYQGETAQATLLVKDSLQRFRQRGNYSFIADALGILGQYALLRGDITEARAYVQEVITIGTTHNMPGVHAQWQWLLGLVMLYDGDVGEARRLLNKSLHLCLEYKMKHLLARICTFLAEIALWENELAQSEQWLTQSLTHQATSQPITIYEVERLWVAARLATAQQQYQRAARLFGLSEQAHSQIHYAVAGPMRALADAALATVRAALDPTIFAEAFAIGQQMSLDDAFATILIAADVAGPMTEA